MSHGLFPLPPVLETFAKVLGRPFPSFPRRETFAKVLDRPYSSFPRRRESMRRIEWSRNARLPGNSRVGFRKGLLCGGRMSRSLFPSPPAARGEMSRSDRGGSAPLQTDCPPRNNPAQPSHYTARLYVYDGPRPTAPQPPPGDPNDQPAPLKPPNHARPHRTIPAQNAPTPDQNRPESSKIDQDRPTQRRIRPPRQQTHDLGPTFRPGKPNRPPPPV